MSDYWTPARKTEREALAEIEAERERQIEALRNLYLRCQREEAMFGSYWDAFKFIAKWVCVAGVLYAVVWGVLAL